MFNFLKSEIPFRNAKYFSLGSDYIYFPIKIRENTQVITVALVANNTSPSVQIPELMPDWCRTATIFLGRVSGAHDHILSDGSWVTPDAWLHKLIFCERL